MPTCLDSCAATSWTHLEPDSVVLVDLLLELLEFRLLLLAQQLQALGLAPFFGIALVHLID